MICNYCNNTILQNSNIYKGFDMNFCSVHCRFNVYKQINKLDARTMNYNKWRSMYNNKPENHKNSSLKKTYSIRKELSSKLIIYNTENDDKELEENNNNINEINKNLFKNDSNKMNYSFYDDTITLIKCKNFELIKSILQSTTVKYLISYILDIH